MNTHLGIFERRKYSLVYQVNVGCQVNIWSDPCENSILPTIFSVLIPNVIQSIKLHQQIHDFVCLDILFFSELKDKSGLKTAELSNLGQISIQESIEGKDIIKIGLEEIGTEVLSEYEDNFEIIVKNPQKLAIFARDLINKIIKTLNHEITHLWHFKKSKIISYRNKNYKKICQITSKLDQLAKEKSNEYEEKSILHEYLKLIARLSILREELIYEGFAPLVSDIISNDFDFENVLQDSSDNAIKLNKDLNTIYECFEKMQENFVLNNAEKMAKLKMYADIFTKKFIDLKKYSGAVGQIIPATLFYVARMDLVEISKLHPIKMRRAYEKVCKESSVKLVVSTIPKKMQYLIWAMLF